MALSQRMVPSKPLDLRVLRVTNNMIRLEWREPEHPNGVLLGYRLFYTHKNYTDVRTLRNPEPRMEYVLTDLEPYRTYKIWLKAFTLKHDGEPCETLVIWTDVEGPSEPHMMNVSCHSLDSIYLQWHRPHRYYHQIDCYYVYYRPENSWEFQQLAVESPNNGEEHSMLIPNLTSNTMYEVKVRGATRSLIERSYVYKGPFSEPRKVLLQPHCSREAVSSIASMSSESDGVSAGMVSGLVCASFLLVLVILALILWRKYFQASYYYLDDPPPTKNQSSQLNMTDIYSESEYPSIPVHLWAKHVGNLHADGDIGFSKEYEAIQAATATDISAEQSQATDNKPKNRYLNIVAYDHNRVLLRPIPGQKKYSDYINANYIDGYYKQRAYIGTQGPLPSTFGDFWRMVWEQRVRIIVMITNLIERGRRKCDMYWPKEGIELYGFVQVKLVDELVMCTYTIRTFTLKNTRLRKRHQCERTVYQYHYTNWPDHGVPEHPLPVLSFVRKSAAANTEDAGPIIVHCSAGVGRTGTYIVIDAMLRQIKHSHDLNVFAFLKHIRMQRNYLVQTEEQYIFIHDALLEAIDSGETEIGTQQLGRYLQHLQMDGDALTSSTPWHQLDRQFKLVTAFVPKDFQLTSFNKPCNSAKNRSTGFKAVDAHRVHITSKPGIEGSDYVNATFLQGFNKLREFIITQHPLMDTMTDFWQMIWDHNAQTIVVISAVDEQEWEPFWPTKDDPLITESFTAKLSTENDSDSGYNTKDFIMHSNQDDYELVCRLIYCSNWPECSAPLAGVFDLVTVVQGWFSENQNGPVVIVDRFGGTEAATFACLSSLKKQLDVEHRVDVYQYAKLYHMRRPGVWKSQDDYLFLYRAIESLVGNSVTVSATNALTSSTADSVDGGRSSSLNGHLVASGGASKTSSTSLLVETAIDNNIAAHCSPPCSPRSSSATRTPTPTLPSPTWNVERIAVAVNGSPV